MADAVNGTLNSNVLKRPLCAGSGGSNFHKKWLLGRNLSGLPIILILSAMSR